jgi:hypothetical protein
MRSIVVLETIAKMFKQQLITSAFYSCLCCMNKNWIK